MFVVFVDATVDTEPTLVCNEVTSLFVVPISVPKAVDTEPILVCNEFSLPTALFVSVWIPDEICVEVTAEVAYGDKADVNSEAVVYLLKSTDTTPPCALVNFNVSLDITAPVT